MPREEAITNTTRMSQKIEKGWTLDLCATEQTLGLFISGFLSMGDNYSYC